MQATVNSVCRVCPHRGRSVFADLADDQLDELCGFKIVTRYRRHQRVFYEGEPSLGLSILCSGKAKLSRSSPGGKTQTLGVTGPCGLLAERDLFLSDRHSVTAEAIEDCVVAFVRKEPFLDFLSDHPPLALRMIHRLAAEVADAEDRAFALSALDVRRRLAALLLDLAERYGKPVRDGCLIDVELTREDLAAMIGATPETVIRILSGLRSDGIIQRSSRALILLDSTRLRAILGA